jgi:hypothetical protein
MSWTKSEREIVKRHLSAWIETVPLAEAILNTMEEQKADIGYRFAMFNARKLWLDFLETELHQGLSNSLAALVDKGEIPAEPLPF